MKMPLLIRRAALAGIIAFSTLSQNAVAAAVRVGSDAELRRGLAGLRAGDELVIAPGNYRGGVSARGLRGEARRPVIVRGEDPKRPPVFRGGNVGWHLSGCNNVTLRDIRVVGFPGNGINIDEGGAGRPLSEGIRLERVSIEDTGPRGNHDGLKLSGLAGFQVVDCAVAGWGGSAIDMVGCHKGRIEGCRFVGKDGFSQSNGVQAKGGSSDIVIHDSIFNRAGQRGVNLGGSTGAPYFRPKDATFEATGVVVENCQFEGGLCAVAFVNSKDCIVRYNLIYKPDKWIFRILQESQGDRFPPCQAGVFESNLVVYDRSVRSFVNIGPKTLPETFTLRGNFWSDSEGARRPNLPIRESGGRQVGGLRLRRDRSGALRTSGSGLARELGAVGIATMKTRE